MRSALLWHPLWPGLEATRALFLRGEIPVAALTEDELDRIIGSIYAYVEQSFPSLIRLGYASRFS